MFQNSVLGTLTWICFIIYAFEYVCLYLCVSDIWLQLGFIRAKTVVSFLPKRRLPVMMKHHIPYPFQARRFPLAARASQLLTFYSRTSQSSQDRFCIAHQKATPVRLRSCLKKSLGKIVQGYMPVITRGVSRAENQPFFPGWGKEVVWLGRANSRTSGCQEGSNSWPGWWVCGSWLFVKWPVWVWSFFFCMLSL